MEILLHLFAPLSFRRFYHRKSIFEKYYSTRNERLKSKLLIFAKLNNSSPSAQKKCLKKKIENTRDDEKL